MIESSALYSLLNRLKDVLPSKNLQLLAISLTALKGQRKRVIPHYRKVDAEVAEIISSLDGGVVEQSKDDILPKISGKEKLECNTCCGFKTLSKCSFQWFIFLFTFVIMLPFESFMKSETGVMFLPEACQINL